MDNFAANLKEVNDLIDADILHSKLLHECYRCNEMRDDCTFAPDPFNSDINDDETEVWECPSCREDSAGDI